MMMHWSEDFAGNDESLSKDNTIQFNEATTHLEQCNKAWKNSQIRGTYRNSYKL